MDRILNYIKSWFAVPLETSRKRRALDDLEFEHLHPKFRRLNYPMNPSFLDEDIFNFSTVKRSPQGARKLTKTMSPITVLDTICLEDDDDEVIEVTCPREMRRSLNKSYTKFTSTPTETKPKATMNGDDDVLFVADFKLPATNNSKLNNSSKYNFSTTNHVSTARQDSHNGAMPRLKISPIVMNSNSLVNGKPKYALDHSFRLDEKLKYQQLLQKTRPMFQTATNSSGCQTNSSCYQTNSSGYQTNSSCYQTPVGKLYNSGVGSNNSRGKKMLSMVNNQPKEKTGTFVKKVLDELEKETIEITDTDSDVVEILPTPPSPKPDIKVDPVNTLRPVIKSTATTSTVWLENIRRNHREVLKRRQNEIDEYLKQEKQLHEINTDIRIGALTNAVDRALTIKEYILPIEEDKEEEFPELTNDHLALVKKAFSGSPNEVLCNKFSLTITRRDIQTLQNLNWLNDEVINFYMNLIADRSKNNPKYPKTYTTNTFFYPKLIKDGPASLRRWTKRVDIFSYDIMCIPIHLGVHWCMSIIDFRDKSIRYFDSMGSNNRECLRQLRRYLEHEHMDKKKTEYDTSEFELEDVKDIPQQMNGSDCGMFSCMFAEYLSRDAKITFTQEHMPYFRKKMVVEILTGALLIQ